MKLINNVHDGLVHSRRVRVLCDTLSDLLSPGARVLDVGSGDGYLASLLQRKRPDISVEGIDVLVRDRTHIPVRSFNGHVIPYGNGEVDEALFVDVLHHTTDPMILLREARRVARKAIVLKDHTLNGAFAGATLRFMDRVGNSHHGVALPYTYWPREQWQDAFQALSLRPTTWISNLGLYPWPADLVFGRSLHFVARLEIG